ncbi:hypothetical protein R3P38DRAFT_3234947 [Favolaschia claudopus]|uniref:Uncharacterized protein n=1 Tax=Favolaschia claudopus TaxID=2862362 RepID=A0AAV9ZF52_9AGAR
MPPAAALGTVNSIIASLSPNAAPLVLCYWRLVKTGATHEPALPLFYFGATTDWDIDDRCRRPRFALHPHPLLPTTPHSFPTVNTPLFDDTISYRPCDYPNLIFGFSDFLAPAAVLARLLCSQVWCDETLGGMLGWRESSCEWGVGDVGRHPGEQTVYPPASLSFPPFPSSSPLLPPSSFIFPIPAASFPPPFPCNEPSPPPLPRFTSILRRRGASAFIRGFVRVRNFGHRKHVALTFGAEAQFRERRGPPPRTSPAPLVLLPTSLYWLSPSSSRFLTPSSLFLALVVSSLVPSRGYICHFDCISTFILYLTAVSVTSEI